MVFFLVLFFWSNVQFMWMVSWLQPFWWYVCMQQDAQIQNNDTVLTSHNSFLPHSSFTRYNFSSDPT